MSTPLSESRKRRVHSAGERVVLDALAYIGTAVALFSVVKRQHEGFAPTDTWPAGITWWPAARLISTPRHGPFRP